MSSILRTVKGQKQLTHYCDVCGKKISKKGELIKTAHSITSNSLPQYHGKELCDKCYKQI